MVIMLGSSYIPIILPNQYLDIKGSQNSETSIIRHAFGVLVGILLISPKPQGVRDSYPKPVLQALGRWGFLS